MAAGSQGPIHHVGIGVARERVQKGLREAAHNYEAQTLPEAHGAFIGADDKIKLHGAEAAGFGALKRMCGHGAGNSAADGGSRSDVAAVGDVGAPALLIGAKKISADDARVLIGDEDFVMA